MQVRDSEAGRVDWLDPVFWERASVADIRRLHADGELLDGRGDFDGTPLHFAAGAGNTAAVKELLRLGADYNALCESGCTPMHWAAKSGHVDAVKELKLQGASLSARSKDKSTPLHYATICGAVVIKKMIDLGMDVNARRYDEATPLHLAVRNGDVAAIKELIAQGADVNAVDKYGTMPLHLAVDSGSYSSVEALLDAGADVNGQQDGPADPPLHRAAWRGQTLIVRRLMEAGANLEARARDGATPLQRASDHYRGGIAHILVAAGAQIEADCDVPETVALFEAAYCGPPGKMEAALLAIDPAMVSCQNRHGDTALHLSARQGNTLTALTLIDAGADCNAANLSGETPLHALAGAGKTAPPSGYMATAHLINRMIDGNADIEACDAQGMTPMHHAAAHDVNALKALLDAKAGMEARDAFGATPLLIAVLANNEDCIKALINAGASLEAQDKQGQSPLRYLNAIPEPWAQRIPRQGKVSHVR